MTDLSNPYGTAFGLLDQVYGEGTARAMREHGGPYERFYNGEWEDDDEPLWTSHVVRRVKPAPPKPREWWIVIYDDGSGCAYPSRYEADRRANYNIRAECVHVIEKLP